ERRGAAREVSVPVVAHTDRQERLGRHLGERHGRDRLQQLEHAVNLGLGVAHLGQLLRSWQRPSWTASHQRDERGGPRSTPRADCAHWSPEGAPMRTAARSRPAWYRPAWSAVSSVVLVALVEYVVLPKLALAREFPWTSTPPCCGRS